MEERNRNDNRPSRPTRPGMQEPPLEQQSMGETGSRGYPSYNRRGAPGRVGAVPVSGRPNQGKSQGPSLISGSESYGGDAPRVGAIPVSGRPQAPTSKGGPSISRGSDTYGASRVGAVAVSGAPSAPNGKSGGPTLTSTSDAYGNQSSRVGAVAVSGTTSYPRTKRDAPSLSSGSDSYGASRVGAHSVSGARRPSKSGAERVGAVPVAGVGSTKGAGPAISSGADTYGDEAAVAAAAAEGRRDSSTKGKERASKPAFYPGVGDGDPGIQKTKTSPPVHFAGADSYDQAGRQGAARRTAQAPESGGKGRVSVMPSSENYDGGSFHRSEGDPKGKAAGPSAAAYAGGGLPEKGKGGPSHFSADESYDGHGDTASASGVSAGSSMMSATSRERRAVPAGAFHIAQGGTVESRLPGQLTNAPDLHHTESFQPSVALSVGPTPSAGTPSVRTHSIGDFTSVGSPEAEYSVVSGEVMRKTPWYRSPWFILAAAAVIITGVAVGVAVPLVAGGSGDGDAAASNPTMSPSVGLDLVRLGGITDLLVDNGITDMATIIDSSTPQSSALMWIVNEDELTPLSTGAVTAGEFEKIRVRYSLATIYYATGGDSWASSNDWLNGRVEECFWEFLSCVSGKIVQFCTGNCRVGSNNMVGTLPSEMRELTALQLVGLGVNSISDVHPDFGFLPSIAQLILQRNMLSGTLPSFIYRLTQLQVLDFTGNFLTGSISPELSNLSRLAQLSLGDNQMKGVLTDEFSRTTALQAIQLQANKFSGNFHDVIRNQRQLGFLNLIGNRFEGNLNGTLLQRHTELREIAIGGNSLNGTIPTEIGNLQQLGSLLMDSMDLSGTIPTELAMCPLEMLNLEFNNRLSGPVPPELCSVPTLVDIRVNCDIECPCRSCFASGGDVCP